MVQFVATGGFRITGYYTYIDYIPPIIFDPYYYYTRLLLTGEQYNFTSGSTSTNNNVIIDASTSSFALTRNNTPTQGSFTPFSPARWSGYFKGNPDYLSVAHSTALNLASGDFTIEAWVYWTGANVSATVMDKDGVSGSSINSYDISLVSSRLSFTVGSGNGVSYVQAISAASTLPTNQWIHVAGVKSGTTLTLYQNGISVASATQTGTIIDGGKPLLIGYQTGQPAAAFWSGYISNVRIIKGTALYTANFTPPTSALTAVANTSLLVLQDNRFRDNSTNNTSTSVSGTPQIVNFSPFAPTAAYSIATHGSSIYFNGTNDWIRKSGSGVLAGGDITIDTWIYPMGTSVINLYDGGSAQTNVVRNINANTFGNQSNDAGGANITGFFTPNTWFHLAITYSGTVVKAYVNGTFVSSGTTLASYTVGNNFDIGTVNGGGAGYFNGFISDFRVTNGLLYTANFTPPTAPISTATNTSLLLNGQNAGVVDVTTRNNLVTVGSARTTSTVFKNGIRSIQFNGSTDYLSNTSASTSTGNLSVGDFTVEFWMNATAAGTSVAVVGTQSISGNTTAGMWRISNRLSSANGIYFNYTTGSAFVDLTFSTTNYNDGTWHHVAACRSSNTLSMFVDGVLVGTPTTVSQNLSSNQKLYVGFQAQDNTYYTGYIDDLRITTGVARYSSSTSFAPPTSSQLQ